MEECDFHNVLGEKLMGFAGGLNMIDQGRKEKKRIKEKEKKRKNRWMDSPKIFGLCKSGLEHGVPETPLGCIKSEIAVRTPKSRIEEEVGL